MERQYLVFGVNPFIQSLEFCGKENDRLCCQVNESVLHLESLEFDILSFESRHLLVRSSDVRTKCLRANSLRQERILVKKLGYDVPREALMLVNTSSTKIPPVRPSTGKPSSLKLQKISEALFLLCKSPKDHKIQWEVILRHYSEQAVTESKTGCIIHRSHLQLSTELPSLALEVIQRRDN